MYNSLPFYPVPFYPVPFYPVPFYRLHYHHRNEIQMRIQKVQKVYEEFVRKEIAEKIWEASTKTDWPPIGSNKNTYKAQRCKRIKGCNGSVLLIPLPPIPDLPTDVYQLIASFINDWHTWTSFATSCKAGSVGCKRVGKTRKTPVKDFFQEAKWRLGCSYRCSYKQRLEICGYSGRVAQRITEKCYSFDTENAPAPKRRKSKPVNGIRKSKPRNRIRKPVNRNRIRHQPRKRFNSGR